MKKEKINKVEMARRMHTSRALDRLLDPETVWVTLRTLCKAARAIGRDLRFELIQDFLYKPHLRVAGYTSTGSGNLLPIGFAP